MVIIMFDPSALDLPAYEYEYFEMMYRNFEYNFAMTFDENGDIKYILRTYNSVADDFLLMEEARKSMNSPKSASIVRKRYHSSNMEAMIKAAKECGIQLDVPDFLS